MGHWDTLKPYGEAVADLYARVEKLDDGEFEDLARASSQPSSTNCWWANYEAARLLTPLIAAERYRRQRGVKGPARPLSPEEG